MAQQHATDDGLNGVVVGIPRYGAGALDLRTGPSTAQRVTQSYFTGLPTAETGDEFAAASTMIYANTDNCDDIAIGVPGAAHGAGAVDVALGSDDGFVASGAIQIRPGVAGGRFGSALIQTAGDLFVGAPARTVDGHADAGAVYEYRLSTGKATLVRVITQDTPGVAGAPEPGDRFGAVLSRGADQDGRPAVMIGIPDEDIGTLADAGMVTRIILSGESTPTIASSQSWTQNSPGVVGGVEAGDRFGAAVAGNLIGVPGEDIGSIKDAGMAEKLPIVSGHRIIAGASWSQDSPGIPGGSEAGDHFGAAVGEDDCGTTGGSDPIQDAVALIGAPDEDIGTNVDAGRVTRINEFHSSLSTCQTAELQKGAEGIPGTPRAGDQFGAAIYVNFPYFNDLGFAFGGFTEIAVPGQDVGAATDAGEVIAFPFLKGPTVVTDSTGPKAAERYGTLPTQ